MKQIIIIFLLGGALLNTYSQTNPLNDYIRQGLNSNLALQQNILSLKSAEQSLKVAKGMFLPSAELQSRYTLARGGRTIDFPIGDLLNPVYSTLNQMLEAQGQAANFPQVENEQINFIREFEYETSVSVIQPIYNRSLFVNKKIKEEQFSMNVAEIELFKKELTLKIKEAYFNYLKTI